MLDSKRDELLRTLSEHPGFKELVKMFDEEAEVLRTELETKPQKTVEDYYKLQLGLKWLRYAKTKVKQSVDKRLETIAARPTAAQDAQLKAVLSQFEGV